MNNKWIYAFTQINLQGLSLFQSTVNTQVFDAWVIQDLLPKLPPRSVIVLDNATFHKGKQMRLAVEQAGHTLYQFPYIINYK